MRRRDRGTAIVEFALVLPFLLVLSFIAIELGRAVYQYGLLTKSVRDAARYLSMQTPGTHIDQARNLVVYGNVFGTGSPLAPGLVPAQVPDPTWQAVGTAPVINAVTVEIDGYSFQSLLPGGAFGLSFGPIAYSSIRATMRSQL